MAEHTDSHGEQHERSTHANAGREHQRGAHNDDTRSTNRTNTAVGRSNERSVTTLLRDLVTEATALVRNEAALARAEVSEKVSSVQTGAMSMAVAMVLLLIGLIGLMDAAISALALVWPIWLAALVIGGGIVIVGLIALAVGRSKIKAANMSAPRMSREFDKDRSFVQEQTR